MPAGKIQKTAATSRARQKGQGSKKGKGRAEYHYCLTQMPVDILLSICSELDPVDLLHLSRVSKGFHDFLWLKSSSHVWRLAYENLSPPQRPPPCPLDVCIIHYTNFLFGNYCQFCLCHRSILTKNDAALVQLCSKCVNKHTIISLGVEEEFRTLCHSDNGINILEVEYKLRQRELAQATREGTVSKYLEQRQIACEYRSQHLASLINWRYELTRIAHQEKTRILTMRRSSMQNRLMTEGCIPVHILWQAQRLDFPHMKDVHELTDDEWRHIRADVIEFLFDYSENQQRNSIGLILTNCLKSLDVVLQQTVASRPRISPTVFHVASQQPFSNLVKSSFTLDKTVDAVLGQVAMLPSHIAQWRQDTDAYLKGLLPKFRDTPRFTSKLELAVTFFRCFGCTEPISYPRILMHHCFLRASGEKGAAGTKIQKKGKKPNNAPREPRPMSMIDADSVFPSLSNVFGEGMHPGRGGVYYYREASKSARKIILACGENPGTITNTEMDQKDFRVECLLCSSTRRGRLVMRWTTAILHDLDKHGSEIRAPWRLVYSTQDLETVQREEKKIVESSIFPTLYHCRLCDLPVAKDPTHLINSHQWGGDEPNVMEQYYKDIDLTMALPPLAVKI